MKTIWIAVKKFFRWPYANQAIIGVLGVIEYLTGFHFFGVATFVLGVWAFLISYNEPKP